jgi:hypothetical protein
MTCIGRWGEFGIASGVDYDFNYHLPRSCVSNTNSNLPGFHCTRSPFALFFRGLSSFGSFSRVFGETLKKGQTISRVTALKRFPTT